MDELKKRLGFQNSTVQIQAIWRLQVEIGNRKPTTSRIDANTPQILEWNLLLDCLCGDEAIVGETASQALLQLVEDDVVDYTYALNSVLNSVPSAKFLSGLVKAVYGLLNLQAAAALSLGKPFKSPYTLRSPPHPLISVITNRPDAWPFLVEQAGLLFKHRDKRVHSVAVEVLRPFITFLLVEPQQSDQYGDARAGLQHLLVAVYRTSLEEQTTQMIGLILHLLPKIPMDKKEGVLFVSRLATDMASAINTKLIMAKERSISFGDKTLDVSTPKWLTLAADLLPLGLEILLKCIRVGASLGTFLEELNILAQFGSGVSHLNSNLLLLSDLLASPLVNVYPQLIALAQAVIKSFPSTPNILCLASLIKPLLQPLALPNNGSASSLSKPQTSARTFAGQLLQDIQAKMASGQAKLEDQVASLPFHLSSAGYRSELVKDLCHALTHANTSGTTSGENVIMKKEMVEAVMLSWLGNIQATLQQQDACSSQLLHLVAAILATSRSEQVTRAALGVILKIAQVDPKQAPDLLPLILYVLGQNQIPESRLILLETIPQLATHKFCVPPILKTIQALGKAEDLKAVSIRLMVLLWKQQDRVFPQLLHSVSEPHVQHGADTMIDNVLLAKAAAILEICKHKPEQHGAELLAPLSGILDIANSDRDIPISVLALDGLYLLCKAEVIDLKSVWSVLGEKLIHETRPLVVTRICRLLSLVPELTVETEEYETFAEEAVSCLWLYTLSSSSEVSAAAFDALAKFKREQFRVSHLPRKVTEELHSQAELAAQQQGADEGSSTVDVDLLFPQVPGSCYTSLLETLTDERTIQSYKRFLHAMASQEVKKLPRGVFYSSLRRQGVAAGQGKAIESIPTFLLQQYDKCKQPGLRPGLAAGLLFCYDPPLEVGRDGRPRKHYIVRHGKTFLQTLTTLLQEVPVQPSEWHRCALTPQAWNSFMERLFLSLLESQKAELELQEKHGHASIFEINEKKSLAWLSVRDTILGAIKVASECTPAAQANSVLALAGLALCVHKFAKDLDSEQLEAADRSSEYMGHIHWLTVTSDTILSLIDIQYKPKGGLHGLCQQRSTLDRSPASTLCSGMARLAASQLVPILIAMDTEKILHLLNTFAQALPKAKAALDSPVLAFCNGLALGMLLGRLFEEHYSEMTGSKGMLAVWKALTALEEVCLAADAEKKTGCVLGLGLAISGMCSEGKTESRVHVTTLLEKLQELWLKTAVDDTMYQCLSVAVTSIAGSVYASNTSTEEVVLPVLDRLKQVHKDNPQIVGVCLALGLLSFSLSKLGHRAVAQLRQELVSGWIQDVIKEDTSPVERVAKLNGLLSMIGSEQTLIPVQGSSMMTGSDVNVSEVIAMVTRIVVDHSDLGLQSVSSWMLGHLYLSACAVGENRSSVPANYGYLPEASILRAVVDFLLEAGRLGPESVSSYSVVTCLESLKMKASLPPVNWAGLLSPFMRVNYDDAVKTLSLQTAASQMVSSSSAAIFLSSWLTPPLFTSLQPKTQAGLHQCMPEIIKSTSPAVLKLYLERSCLPAFTEETQTDVRLSILQGLRDALAVDDPPEAVTLLLYEITGQLYHVLPNEFNVPILQSMAECLAQVPDDIVDSIIVADFADASTQIKGSFVRCHLVATGRQPLSLLNYMIDASLNTDYWNHDIGLLFLSHSLVNFSKLKVESSGPLMRQQWLSELLGHTRSIVTGAMPLAETAPSLEEVISHVINLVTCAILTLTFPAYSDLDLWGFNPNLFKSDSKMTWAREEDPAKYDFMDAVETMCKNINKFLPAVVDVLVKKPWDVIIPKIIDWLMTLIQMSETKPNDQLILYAALMTLRHCQEMRQASTWTKAAILLDN